MNKKSCLNRTTISELKTSSGPLLPSSDHLDFCYPNLIALGMDFIQGTLLEYMGLKKIISKVTLDEMKKKL